METKNITFIGAGNMARALIMGLIATGYPAEHITASNPPNDALDAFQQQFGINLLHDNHEAVRNADVVVLSIKQNVLHGVCEEIKDVLVNNKPLVVSVIAGVTTQLLSQWLGELLPIVRTMPNTPTAVLAGATGLFATDATSEKQKELAEALFRAVGITVWVDDEEKMDLITAISGSGPAYYFLMIEAIQEEAIRMGLPEKDARLLCLQTILGAARMALESQHDVRELRRSITSPKGTTEAAIKTLEEGSLRSLLEKAIHAAYERAQSLSEDIRKES